MKKHTVTKYEVLSLMPAPAGMEAVFKMDEGDDYHQGVFAFAVAKVTQQDFNEHGVAMGDSKQQPNELVGLLSPDGEPMFAHDMIAEETSNFQGYRRRPGEEIA